MIKRLCKDTISVWNAFWFDSNSDECLLNISVFRFFFYATMCFFYITRAQDVPFFYGEDGLIQSRFAQSLEVFRYHPSIFFGVKSIFLLNAAHTVFILLLACCALGLLTRVTTVAAYFLHMMFLNRDMSVMFGVDMIGTFFLLYMCFTNSGAHYSLDNLIFKNRRRHSGPVNFVAYRLMQLQLCVIYAYAGLEKLKGTRWWSGAAIWDVMSMGNMQRWDMSFVAHVPILLAAATFVVLFWEIYFPILVWNRRFTNLMLLFGVLLHIGIGVFMNLPSFGAMMISFYILFLSKDSLFFLLAALQFPKKTP